MRILMLGVKEYPYGVSAKYEKYPGGGTARYVISLSEGLVEKGYEVDLIVRKFPGQKKFEKSNGINIHRVFWINNRYLRLPSFNFFAFLRALKIARKVDIIHCHGSFSPVFGIILGRLFKKKVIGTPHGTTSYGMRFKYGKVLTKLVEFLEKQTFSKLDLMIFLNGQEKRNICSTLNFKPRNSIIIYPGIKIPKFKPIKKNGKFRIIYVGRLVSIKRIDNLIKAISLLPKNIQDKVEVLIVGEGYSKNELIELTKNLNLTDKIKFIGYTNNVYGYLKSSDVFVLPSEREGLPCSILEAMSIGLPVIIKRNGFSSKAFYFIKGNDAPTIAKSISTLFTNKNLRDNLKIRAITEFKDQYSIKKTVVNQINAYNET